MNGLPTSSYRAVARGPAPWDPGQRGLGAASRPLRSDSALPSHSNAIMNYTEPWGKKFLKNVDPDKIFVSSKSKFLVKMIFRQKNWKMLTPKNFFGRQNQNFDQK